MLTSSLHSYLASLTSLKVVAKAVLESAQLQANIVVMWLIFIFILSSQPRSCSKVPKAEPKALPVSKTSVTHLDTDKLQEHCMSHPNWAAIFLPTLAQLLYTRTRNTERGCFTQSRQNLVDKKTFLMGNVVKRPNLKSTDRGNKILSQQNPAFRETASLSIDGGPFIPHTSPSMISVFNVMNFSI